jgi:hypothetical protein
MKPFVTAASICTLLLLVVASQAATWVGDELNANWGTAGNWDPGNVPDSGAESATITSKTTYWPQLDNDYTIDDMTLGGSAELDTNGNKLEVDVFTINDSADILLTNSSNDDGELECSSTSYTPANVAITISATGNGSMTVEVN